MIVDESLKLATLKGEFIRMRQPHYSVRIVVAHITYLIRATVLFTDHKYSFDLVYFGDLEVSA